jgi:hypothetical protein
MVNVNDSTLRAKGEKAMVTDDDVRNLVSAARQLVVFEREMRRWDERGEALPAGLAASLKKHSTELCDALALAADKVDGKAPAVVMWGGRPMREGKCSPGSTCLACDRLGKHLEPLAPENNA